MLPTLQRNLAGFDNRRWLLMPGEIFSGLKLNCILLSFRFIWFMVAIARESLNYDDAGDSFVDPLVWDRGMRAKVRKTEDRGSC